MIWYLLVGVIIVFGYQFHLVYDEEHNIATTFKTLWDCIITADAMFRPLYLTVTCLTIVGWPFTLAIIIDLELKAKKKKAEHKSFYKSRK